MKYKKFYSLIIDERVHQKSLLNETLPLWTFSLEISIRVVGHNDAVGVVRQFHYETVVIANHTFSSHPSGWREYKKLSPLQLP